MDKIKIGLLGVGHLGKIHLKCLQKTDFEIVGIYDPDPAAQEFVKQNYDIPIFDSAESLVEAVDAVDIVSTTITHFDLGIYAINKGKHAFIEKPIASTLEQAKELEAATIKNNVKVHVESLNKR